MKHKSFLQIVSLSLLLFSLTNLYTTDQYPGMLSDTVASPFLIQRYSEEGFAADTLVRTLSGYQRIETITEHDTVLDNTLQPKKVFNVARRISNRCIDLTIDGKHICMGYEQAVCLPYNTQWCLAGDVQEKEYLLSANGRVNR